MEYTRRIEKLLHQEKELERLGIKIPNYFDSEIAKAHREFTRARRGQRDDPCLAIALVVIGFGMYKLVITLF